MKHVNFNTAYLKTLNLIKQDIDEDKKDLTSECGDNNTVEVSQQDEVISEEDGDEVEVDTEVDTDVDTEQEPAEEEVATCFCFKTTNQDLIDAINSGFDKVVFTVKATDEEGNDTTTDIEFTGDDFQEFEECDCEEADQDESDDDTSSNDFEDAPAANSFESVFKKYYKALISEDIDSTDIDTEEDDDSVTEQDEKEKTACPECGNEPCTCEEKTKEDTDVCPECGEKECTCCESK